MLLQSRPRWSQPDWPGRFGYSRTRRLMLSLVLVSSTTLLAVACEAPRESAGPVAVTSGTMFEVFPDSTPISVDLYQSAGIRANPQFTADVSGVSGPFSFRWFERHCPGDIDDIDCSTTYTNLVDTAQTITIRLPDSPRGLKAHIAVEVKQVGPDGRSGADSLSYTYPAATGYVPTTHFVCDMGTLGFQLFPFEEWKWTPDSGYVRTNVIYRRNPCTGVKEIH